MAENEKWHAEVASAGNELPATGPPPSRQADAEVVALARSMTNLSQSGTTHDEKSGDSNNPFLSAQDPSLDPLSGKFDPVRWTKSILQIQGSDPDGYPHHTAAVSFSNLNVYGYGKPTDHQKTVGNYFLDITGVARDLLGSKGQRIDILRNFEGYVLDCDFLVKCLFIGMQSCPRVRNARCAWSPRIWLHDPPQDHCRTNPRTLHYR